MKEALVQISRYLGQAVQAKITRFAELSPLIIGALAVFLFGWVLGELTARLILAVAPTFRLELIAEKIGLNHFLQRTRTRFKATQIVAQGVKGYIIFLFFIEATKVAQLPTVAEFLSTIIAFFPDLIVAIFILMIGFRFANTFQVIISTSFSFAKSETANALGIATKGMVVVFTVLAALAQLQIAPILVQVLFVGFVAMMTIGGGLAIGLGGKDVVKEFLEELKTVEVKKGSKK